MAWQTGFKHVSKQRRPQRVPKQVYSVVITMAVCMATPLTTRLVALAIQSAPGIGGNLLLNGDLRSGSGLYPDHWRTEAWHQVPGITTFTWTHRPEGTGELTITNHKPNDARWVQNLTLEPGLYYFSAEIKTKDVPNTAQGASLSILEDGIDSPDLRGTNEWKQVGFYLKVGGRGADVEVACRLGGFSSLNTGTASCRNLQVLRVSAIPSGAGPVFDLDRIRRESTPAPVGSRWTLFAAFSLTIGIAIAGWITLGRASGSQA